MPRLCVVFFHRGVSETVQKQRIANQLMHIERMLNDTLSNPPNWLLVAGHYPIYSASKTFRKASQVFRL